MSQLWQTINVDKRSSCGELGSLLQCLDLGLHVMLATCITRPSWSMKVVNATRLTLPSNAKRSYHGSTALLSLPLDIMEHIFNMIDDVQQAICLCLTDQSLFCTGMRRVVRLHSMMVASGAGSRLVCIGQRTKDGDFPPSVAGEISTWMKESASHRRIPKGSSFYEIASYYSSRSDCGVSREDQLNDDYYCDPDARCLHRRMLASSESPAYQTLLRPAYDSDELWVLCNTSKGVYIRADVVSALAGPGGMRPPMFNGHGGLAEILFFRILWSSCSATSLSFCGCVGDGELHRGKWAGDRLEITTMDRMKMMGGSRKWTDESHKALKDMVEVWRCQMGDDWVKERLEKSRHAVRL